MKSWNRKSPRPSRGQSPKLDRFGAPEHGAGESRDLTASAAPASADDIPPLTIDFARLREAERRLEAGLVEIEALIWSRLQETLRTEDRGGQPHDPRRAHKGANPELRSQARYGNRPRRGQALNRGATSTPQDADHGGRHPASATRMADLIHFIARDDRVFITRQIAGFGVPPADVDDVTQEVLSGVVRSSSRYDASRGKLRTWLYRVAFYQTTRFMGRAYHHREELEATPREALSEALGVVRHEANPEEQAIANEERRLVWGLIDKLESNWRVVFIAYEIMEMTMEEIAQALGIPESTGWGQLRRARRELATALRRHRAREAFASARKRR